MTFTLYRVIKYIILCSSIALSALSPHETSASPRLPAPVTSLDFTAALKALKHPQGVIEGLRHLLSLELNQLERAKSERLYRALDDLLFDPNGTLLIRTWVIELYHRLRVCRPRYLQLIDEGTDGSTLVLARRVAESMRGVGCVTLLERSEALSHVDPEVRAHVASTGARPQALCSRLNDPWPAVRFAAIRGLEKRGGRVAVCLIQSLKDPLAHLQSRAATALGKVGAQEVKADVIKALRRVVQTSKAPRSAREASLISLAQWGDLKPAITVLDTHLNKGGIVSLSSAAVRALSVAHASRQFPDQQLWLRLKRTLSNSGSILVRLESARSLIRWIDAEPIGVYASKIHSLIERVADERGGQEAKRLTALLKAHTSLDPVQNINRGAQDLELPALEDEDREGL